MPSCADESSQSTVPITDPSFSAAGWALESNGSLTASAKADLADLAKQILTDLGEATPLQVSSLAQLCVAPDRTPYRRHCLMNVFSQPK